MIVPLNSLLTDRLKLLFILIVDLGYFSANGDLETCLLAEIEVLAGRKWCVARRDFFYLST